MYLTSTFQPVQAAGLPFVFLNDHGFETITDWFDDPARLDTDIDWATVYARFWNDTLADPDRQRRKQAEFLVHRFLPWELIDGIAIVSTTVTEQVSQIFAGVEEGLKRPISIREDWY